ncbi:MAG TPA: ABC transporter substrate-binding protein [Gaiellaceae bacterium]|nr:ABC transporter substrate-binding protein [Gaiellaceae bacterium]
MRRGQSRRLMLALLAVCALVGASSAAWIGSQRATASSGSTATEQAGGSGILRVGTTSYIDSFNPWNYIEGQGLNAMIMVYPLLVQVDYSKSKGYYITGDWASSWKASKDGKTWTFKLRPNGRWSDGRAMTADDAAWTINTTVKYVTGATAVQGSTVNHVVRATATDPRTLVVKYNAPVGNALWLIGALPIVPRHVWEPYEKKQKGGRALKTYRPEGKIPFVTGGAYTIKSYEKKGTTVFIPDKNFYGPKSNADAVALTYYTNSDSMIAELRRGNLDWIDQVPFNAVNAVKKSSGVKVNQWPGGEITNITWNSNPYKPKNRELLDPRVKKALSMCVDRNKMIQVVFSGYATKVESLVGHISPLENPNLGPTQYNCSAANKALDALGYKRGSDGVRVAPATKGKYAQPAHPMSYEVILPTSLDFNGNRMFEIVKEGFAKLGVTARLKVGGDSTASYALETDAKCDGTKNIGYSKFDLAMWDWIAGPEPDFQLSVVTKDQWCSWSDTGWDSPAYDKLYIQQSVTVNPAKRRAIIYKMQKMVYDAFVYTQLTNHVALDATSTKWTGFKNQLNAFSKTYYTSPKKVR